MNPTPPTSSTTPTECTGTPAATMSYSDAMRAPFSFSLNQLQTALNHTDAAIKEHLQALRNYGDDETIFDLNRQIEALIAKRNEIDSIGINKGNKKIQLKNMVCDPTFPEDKLLVARRQYILECQPTAPKIDELAKIASEIKAIKAKIEWITLGRAETLKEIDRLQKRAVNIKTEMIFVYSSCGLPIPNFPE